ncbi:MAG: L,D-transpeptidase family protein [Hyphomicrobiales bacterium]|nr:L,D-transpeptidase family protein [Hyphomicrobiales bacterium]
MGSFWSPLIGALGFVAGSALVIGASAQTQGPASGVFPGLRPDASSPVLDTLEPPHAPARDEADPFARLAGKPLRPVVTLISGFAERAAANPAAPEEADVAPADFSRPSVPLRSMDAAPDPVPTAIEAALARLIRSDEPINPLGAGDWRGAKAAIGAFYAGRGFAPVWVSESGLTARGRAVVGQLQRAGDDGLKLAPFKFPLRLESGLSASSLAEAETKIAAAIVVYAEQASGSRVAPLRLFGGLVTAEPSVADPGEALAETASAVDPAARLAEFNPPQKGYRELREELKRLTSAAGRAPRSAARLDLDSKLRDPLIDIAVDPSDDEGGARARSRLKRVARNGAYDATVRAPRERLDILANMEMWRWEPRDMGERRIEVNVPDFSITVVEGDSVVHRARVIVGKPGTPTPIFSNVMRYVLINPSWRVPDSIIRKEMMPRLAYLSRHGYEVKTVDGRLAVRQLPGEDNALGRLAFMFPNDHSVYLHDTPAQDLFGADRRAFSHGCVRVEDAVRLAELVLGWPPDRIEAAFGESERTVFLPRPLPIHIEYFTEFVDEFGELQQRADIYGMTRKVAAALSAERQD